MNKDSDDYVYDTPDTRKIELSPLIAVVLPAPDNSTEPYIVRVVWKLIRTGQEVGDEDFKLVATHNVMIPGMKRYFDSTEILTFHSKIKAQLAKHPKAVLEFLFQNVT